MEKWLAPRPKIHRSKCIGCGKCAEICPGHTIHSGKRKGAYRAEGLHPLFLLPRDVPRKGHRCEAGWDIQSVDGKRQK
ncbi:MAG: 4Fe-4S binding protein [Ruthenibacterium lactatiformans]